MSMSFSSWEHQITNAPGYPNNNEIRLAIQTLKVCITESPFADDEIAGNGYALFDYVMFCYFVFRSGLCEAFSQNFVESYDAYIQYLMKLYFNNFYKIQQETIENMIVSRGRKYESLADKENIAYQATATLTQYIEKDLAGIPLSSEQLLTDIYDNFILHMKLSDYIQTTLPALEKQRAFILLCESRKTYTHNNPTPAPSNQNRAQPVIEKKEPQVKQEKPKPAAQPKREKRNSSSLKEKLTNTLGTFGVLLYFVISLFLAALPFGMISGNFFIRLLLIFVNYFLPPTSVIFWTWGLVCAIKGPQDIFAIIYYIVFVVAWIPFYISTITTILRKD